MRTLVALALVLAACGRADRSLPAAHETASTGIRFGPDPLVLRVPRDGGYARVLAYPKMDSVLWTSADRAPALARVLAFDPDGGTIAYVDTRGIPGRMDLRTGEVGRATTEKAKLTDITSTDGRVIYGIGADGAVARLTPTGDWVFKPPRPGRAVFPQRDGSVLLLAGRGASSVVWRLHPPENRIFDTASVPPVDRAIRTQLGDRVYLVDGTSLIGLRTRTLDRVPSIHFDQDILALSATPSGDRLYVANDSTHALSVVDRYRDRVAHTIDLPGQPQELRIDPLGRFLLARAARGDSVWVIAISTDQVVGTVHSDWRADLPMVLADGTIALAQGSDAELVNGQTLQPAAHLADAAKEFWYSFRWNGFRPRAPGLDQPAQFQSDSIDSVLAAQRDSAAAGATTGAAPQNVVPVTPALPARPDTAAAHGFTVSFAALLTEAGARQLASGITVRGRSARILSTTRDGATIYRVVLGPYPTRALADSIGRESRHSYWVYEGAP